MTATETAPRTLSTPDVAEVATDAALPLPVASLDVENTLFHAAPWRNAVEETFGLTLTKFTPRSEPRGSAWYSVVNDIRGRRVVSTPFSDFCEPVLRSQVGWNEFADHLRSFECPVTARPFLNSFARSDSSFELRSELWWHGIDLADGADGVFDSVNTKVRTKIRRPAKSGVTFRASSSSQDIAAMHAMHVHLRKSKYGLLAQPLRFFENLATNFGDRMVVCFAELDGEPLAGMTFFEWNDVWYYKFSASYNSALRVNPALMMFAIRVADERGLQLVDMGRSDADQPGLLSFKEQFRPVAVPLTTLHWSPPGYVDPQGSSAGALLGSLTDLLTRPDVSDATASDASDLLYRYFT